jgi:hypothetical protein
MFIFIFLDIMISLIFFLFLIMYFSYILGLCSLVLIKFQSLIKEKEKMIMARRMR